MGLVEVVWAMKLEVRESRYVKTETVLAIELK